ncbi:MAG: phage baseplate assembly protein V [Sphingomicrobium sp.]
MSDFDRLMSRMKRRVSGMVGRAVLTAIDDDAGIQNLQLEGLADEIHDGVERLQDYGFTSHPHPGAEVAVVFAGGLRSHGLVVGLGDRRYRLKSLVAGEVAIYDDLGQVVHLKRDGILIQSAEKVTIEATGDLLIQSDAKVTVQAPQVIVESDDVQLGGAGGQPVARVGDTVSGGVITSGSAKVAAT